MRKATAASPLAISFAALTIAGGCSGPASIEHFENPDALGPYSSSVAAGDVIFLSGVIGERGGSFEREVTTLLDRLDRELARSDASLADVVSVTVFLTNLDHYTEFNRIYGERLARPYPARATVEVSRLPGEARIEMQAIAIPHDR